MFSESINKSNLILKNRASLTSTKLALSGIVKVNTLMITKEHD